MHRHHDSKAVPNTRPMLFELYESADATLPSTTRALYINTVINHKTRRNSGGAGYDHELRHWQLTGFSKLHLFPLPPPPLPPRSISFSHAWRPTFPWDCRCHRWLSKAKRWPNRETTWSVQKVQGRYWATRRRIRQFHQGVSEIRVECWLKWRGRL